MGEKKKAASAKRPARTDPRRTGSPRRTERSPRQMPSRLAKARLLERIRRDTEDVTGGSLAGMLRKQGYEELPLEEIQDRLSKLRTAFAEFLISKRG